ncbi:MAG: glycosyl hydrolase family 28 protein [Paludibacter sp.]
MYRNFIVIFLWCLITGLNAQHITVYPGADIIPHNNDFTVKVRVPGGNWVDLYEYEVRVNAHKVQKSSMVNFGFDGTVEMAVTSNTVQIHTARIRPLSYNIPHKIVGNTIYFNLQRPSDVSVEINNDIIHNLHVLSNELEKNTPSVNDSNVVYLKAGVHHIDSLYMQNNKSLYLAAGAVLMGKVICNRVKNVRIYGRGILFQGQRGIEITHSGNISVSDLIFINPTHYTIFGGQSNNIKINHIRSFSAKGWSDGIDLMSCQDVEIDRVFMRNSDDCVALYGHRWTYYGDCRNVRVTNSTLWADVAHPILIGTHGNPEPGHWETLENIHFENIDILNHNEQQIDYQGCMAINVSDENLARNISFENIRVEDFQMGQLLNLRVTFNKKYASAPGRGIENVLFKNISYTGKNANLSIIEGYSPNRCIKNIVFDGLMINGEKMSPQMNKPKYMKISDFAKIYEGLFVFDLQYTDTATCSSTP